MRQDNGGVRGWLGSRVAVVVVPESRPRFTGLRTGNKKKSLIASWHRVFLVALDWGDQGVWSNKSW